MIYLLIKQKQIFLQNIDSGKIYEDLKLNLEEFAKIYSGINRIEAINLIKILKMKDDLKKRANRVRENILINIPKET